MKVKLKSKEQLIKEGFTKDYTYWYKGLKKDPDARLHYSIAENLAGKEVEVIRLQKYSKDIFDVIYNNKCYEIPGWLFEKSVLHKDFKSKKSFKIKDKAAVFHFDMFYFPCDFAELTKSEAIKLAKWILRVSK